MLSNLKNIFKIPDLRNKILFTVAMVVVYRLGVADPGARHRHRGRRADPATAANTQGAIGFLNLFSGGGFESFSIFALGIMPYITASIIMQILGVVIPKLEELQQQGAVGQRKITQYTRYVTIAPRHAAGDRPRVHLRHGGAARGRRVGAAPSARSGARRTPGRAPCRR